MRDSKRRVDVGARTEGIGPGSAPTPTDSIATSPVANGPVIVGVEGSERSIDALVLASRLGSTLGRPVLIAHVHPFKQVSSLFAPGECERILREIAESTFGQVREHLGAAREPRMQLISDGSPAAGLHALSERANAALMVIGSSNRSRLGRVLVGGTGERLLSGASAPVAVAPAGYAAASERMHVVGCGFDGSPESYRALTWSAEFARRASTRLHLLSVYERTLPTSLAVGAGLPTEAINDVLRRRRAEELADAVSAVGSGADASQQLLDGDARLVLASESSQFDLLVVGSRGYGPLRAVLLGSVSSTLVRSAQAPLVVVPRSAGDDFPS